jgi:hypothetical protein
MFINMLSTEAHEWWITLVHPSALTDEIVE